MIRRGLSRLCIGLHTIVLRARHGWAPRDVWSLDEHLCDVAGGMLHHLVGSAHGWPESAEFGTFDDWRAAVTLRADALVGYRSDDETTHVPAREALRWVADHLTHLWD